MDFALTEEQRAIQDGIGQVLSDFGDEYWLEKDRNGGFPEEFYRAMAEGGWLGVSFPEEVGGASLSNWATRLPVQAAPLGGDLFARNRITAPAPLKSTECSNIRAPSLETRDIQLSATA